MKYNLLESSRIFHEKTTPLPGSLPYENRRPITVPAQLDHSQVKNLLLQKFPHVPLAHWQKTIAEKTLATKRDTRIIR